MLHVTLDPDHCVLRDDHSVLKRANTTLNSRKNITLIIVKRDRYVASFIEKASLTIIFSMRSVIMQIIKECPSER